MAHEFEEEGEFDLLYKRVREETLDRLKDEFFKYMMNGEWKEFSEVFCRFEGAKSCIITRNNETALHIAVAAGQTKIVLEMVTSLGRGEDASEILRMKNENGNTPLHLAAAMGNVGMCKSIAEVDHKLINIRNKKQESPLFLAARHGQEGAFYSLHSIWKANNPDDFLVKKTKEESDYYGPSRVYEGNTILHAAISGEYFSLALKIIEEYPQLVDYNNTEGSTPLHVLATKPNVFQSGNSFGMLDRIIYHCIILSEFGKETDSKNKEDNNSCKFPENYRTCIRLFYLPKMLFLFLAKLLNIKKQKSADEENPRKGENQKEKVAQIFPPNYETEVFFFSLVIKFFLIITGFGFQRIENIRRKKVRNERAVLIMNKMVEKSSYYKYYRTGNKAADSKSFEELTEGMKHIGSLENLAPESVGESKNWKGSPFLCAAKKGVIEMVEEILKKNAAAVRDIDSDGKNVVLLAAENRQIEVYKLILDKAEWKENVFHQVDNEGNSVMHLAAFLGKEDPWNIYGPALQMQWEYKWYKFVKQSMPPNFFFGHNNKGETAKKLFLESHKNLVEKGSAWLMKTSESCSLVAALNATVAFATISQVPGGLNDQNGEPKLGEKATFSIFSISALVALGFSVTALVYFLAIITSRFQQKEFHKLLPRKLLMGLSALFVSLVSILVTFCCGHIFIVEKNVKPYLYPVYVVTTLPACIFILAQLSLYFDLYTSTFRNQPPHPNRNTRFLL